MSAQASSPKEGTTECSTDVPSSPMLSRYDKDRQTTQTIVTTETPLGSPNNADINNDIIEYAEADTKYAWIIVAAAFCNLTMTMGTLNSFGVYQEYYLNQLYAHKSAVAISWIATLISFCMFIGAIFTGKIIDKIGFKITCFIGALVCGIALVLASFTHQLWQLILTQGIMLGFGASLIFSPSMSIVAQWHTKHRVLATGIAVSGGGVGGMAISAATQAMVNSIGYRWSLRILGILIASVSGCTSILYKRRVSPPKESNIRILVMLVKDVRFLCIAAAALSINMGYFEPLLYVPTAAVLQGGSAAASANVVLVFNAGTTLGRMLSGPIAKVLGPSNANLISSCFSCLLVCIFLLGVNSIPGYYVFSAIFGATSTLYLAINTHILAREFGTQTVATSVGLSMACCGIGVLIGNPTQGALYDKFDRPYGRFVAVSAWAAACFAAATLSYVVLRVIIVRKHGISHFSKI
ncbi:hypothetical protein GGI25_005039 [Coemansia spiralis]|uniref:Major facilitator superfamily (MFS) profile domain-containing protein n=2 Tax=Coemansia TaxID=4863 RepID=A0A9W8KWU0_9FUNG|nr:major facilitator superfamily domain-containing protein [Coemansia spiralis]KAJ1989109.1 hypothetical protein EDC05_004905 [Coemansia umbellata]KAJ2620213.1 hypothetical protein GGI26_005170 [Coemansia sp. RSA 1358]KAJ2672541.1 hypothetical protein GGI25_005039 [Coemansia spiralis]